MYNIFFCVVKQCLRVHKQKREIYLNLRVDYNVRNLLIATNIVAIYKLIFLWNNYVK